MTTRILVPMDQSEMAERALEHALTAYEDPEITVFHVAGVPSLFLGEAMSLSMKDDLDEAAEERAEDVFESARQIAAEYDIEIGTAVALGKPAQEIVERASEFDIVVLGSHGRDLVNRILFGNVAETVARRAPTPVVIVR
ncbi:universal stress protein [Halomicrococcus sp. SG-WS-1]|uniref:universal stress protein n=1 Tax=Halomicrococcus sp. SG-WS-1 TaxID=3439057 RepID=UPI003F78B01D